MGTKDFIEKAGTVVEAFPDNKFKIRLDDDEEREVIGYLAGKLIRYRIRVLPGDKVKVEFSPYDLSNCRITYRFK